MNQRSLDLNLSTKATRKQVLLAHMERVVPWAALVAVIAPYYPEGKNGRPPFELVMLPPYSRPRPSRKKAPGPSMAPGVPVRPAAA